MEKNKPRNTTSTSFLSGNKTEGVEVDIRGKLPKMVVIVGPTASGKTALSLEIAKKFNGEIVSADSRQIYMGMDVGTAKPAQIFRQVPKAQIKKTSRKTWGGKAAPSENIFYSNGIRHHLIDIKNPNQDYSVGQYKKDALAAIRRILKAGKLPIIVGGTGLYVDAIVKNLDIPEVKENKKLRAKLGKEIKTKGLDFVFKKLVELDPEAAYIIDPKNPRRIIRAMEVVLATGRPFSAQRKTGPPLFDFLQIGLKLPPDKLKEKTQRRTSQMIKNGLVEEVRKLVKKFGYTPKTFDAIGYREIIDYLKTTEAQKGQSRFSSNQDDLIENRGSSILQAKSGENRNLLKEAEDLINKNTWHYAKRQMTWFRKNKNIKWFDVTQKPTQDKILETVSKFLGFS